MDVNPREIKSFPKYFDSQSLLDNLNPKNLYLEFFTGLYEQSIEIGEVNRSIKVYIPEDSEQGSESIYIAVPSGINTEEFLEKSGWLSIAEKNQLCIFAFEPINQSWNIENSDSEIKYIDKAYKVINNRQYYNLSLGNAYFVGYKEGGLVLQKYIVSNPKLPAAMAIFDGSEEISLDYMSNVGQEVSDDPYLNKSEIPTPIWIISEKLTEGTKNVIDYWKKSNHCEETAYTFEDGTVYLQSQVSNKTFINEQNVGRVQVTESKVDYFDRAFNEKVWNEFMSKLSRYTNIYNNALRVKLNFDELGIEYKTIDIDGVKREWYEYIPTYARERKQELPLVVALHGVSQNGRIFVGYTEWHKVAEARGFAVVFPTGSLIYDDVDRIPKVGWNINCSEDKYDDVKFISELIKDVKDRRNIDSSRVYISGQSMGSMMTNTLAMVIPEVFAAAGSTSGPILRVGETLFDAISCDDKDYKLPPKAKSLYQIPIRLIFGENDLWGGGKFENNHFVKATIEYWINRNNAGRIDEPLTYRTGLFNNRVYQNYKNMPMVEYTITALRGHSCIPEEMWLLWDDWFSKFSRAYDGSVNYMHNQFVRDKMASHRPPKEFDFTNGY